MIGYGAGQGEQRNYRNQEIFDSVQEDEKPSDVSDVIIFYLGS